MPYFFIVPAYLLLLVVLVGASIAVRFHPRFRAASVYFFAGAVGTLLGFIGFNSIAVLAGIAPVWLSQRFTFPNWLDQVSKYFAAASLLLGPFVASVLGVLLGFIAGVYFGFRRRGRAA